MNIKTKYDPADTENKWYKFWLEHNYFHAVPGKSAKPYTIAIPPPNVTGLLHMGHALNNVLQDVLIRIKRMQGYETLWLPGTDHGGIATQNIVEKKLAKEGLDRQKLGREEFLRRMWEWRGKTGDNILEQLKKLGCSCDWERTRFTMDGICEKAVMKAFVDLYKKGLIYRGEYIVNWCPRCLTALSDIEVEHEEVNGKLWYIKYGDINVATTRPETMLGDTAVAVNPKDKRYKGLIGSTVTLPVMNREIPVIADDFVDPSFGTGAVKVTPLHDPNDFEMGLRHKLPGVKVIDEKGMMTDAAGKYKGMDRYECRKKLVRDLEESGYLEKTEDYTTSIGQCYRCETVIEPLVSEQWFLKMSGMAKMGMDVVNKNKVKFVPERWTKPYMNWLENLHDWCISRQIWWGHRIPVWYCPNSKRISQKKLSKPCEPIVSESKPGRCPQCGSEELIRDPDVLDTWFSSALWPFSTLGWPEKTKELEFFYPTSVLVTGHEILYLWVARMIMMGMELMKDIPYHTVYIHGIVRDSKGKKMSKSYGNVIDPLEVTSKYGTDALRFCLCLTGVMGRDLQVSDENFESARNFANKMWNASRFVMMNMEGYEWTSLEDEERLELSDRWILSEFNSTVKEVTGAFDEYDMSRAARLLYEFLWNKYCDWYLELAKPRLTGKGSKEQRIIVQNVLVEVLEGVLKLLHPIMPFITEEIWQSLRELARGRPHGNHESIMISNWPSGGEIDSDVMSNMGLIIEMITAVRNIRSEMNVPVAKMVEPEILARETEVAEFIQKHETYINALARSKISVGTNVKKPDKAATAVVRNMEVYVPLEGIIDIEKEEARLSNGIRKTEEVLEKLTQKLRNKSFVNNAPEDIVKKARSQEKELQDKKQKLINNLNLLK